MRQKIDAAARRGVESMVVVYAVPSSPGQCRVLNVNAFRFARAGAGRFVADAAAALAPRWLVHVGTQVPLEDDQIFLHYGEQAYLEARAAGLSVPQAYYMPTAADAYVVAFRQWLERFGGGGPWGGGTAAEQLRLLAPRLPRKALLDRYEGHTKSCAECRRALAGVRRARRALGAAAALAGAAAVLAAAVAVCAAAGGGGAGSSAAAAATAASGGGGLGGLLSAALLKAAGAVLAAAGWLSGQTLPAAAAAAPSGAAAAAASRALLAGAGALLLWRAAAAAAKLERSFSEGDYPPQRNTDKTG